ncbi:MAG: hypothetical protein KY434_08495 [Actinobacteria bacterium]|nr:hypothetical protein [Actinomycetota bacterium]
MVADLVSDDVLASDEHTVALVDVEHCPAGQGHSASVVHIYHVDDDGRFTESWPTLLDEHSFPDGFWQ